MPPAHRPRHSSGPATKGSQKTLSFSNSKVTKPNTILSAKGISKSSASPIIKIDTSLLEKEAQLSHVDSTAAVTEQARVELAKPKVARSPEELKAEKITDAQILKYWKEQQAERRTKRVHQEDLDINERVLRLFDISSQYGPCIGITRMKRWVRANKLGLKPPIEVLAILLKEDQKGHDKSERAYVDELMSSKFVLGED